MSDQTERVYSDGPMRVTRAIAIEYDFCAPPETHPKPVLIVAMDGSVWADWVQVIAMRDHCLRDGRMQQVVIARQLDFMLAARGRFPEVSRERVEEIGLEWAAKARMVNNEPAWNFGLVMQSEPTPPRGESLH